MYKIKTSPRLGAEVEVSPFFRVMNETWLVVFSFGPAQLFFNLIRKRHIKF